MDNTAPAALAGRIKDWGRQLGFAALGVSDTALGVHLRKQQTPAMENAALEALAGRIKDWGRQLGFAALGVSDTALGSHRARLGEWLAAGHHGEMAYMARHRDKRCDPARLLPGTVRAICARMDYAPERGNSLQPMTATAKGYVARYARGRDYHKLMRRRLQRLADKIEDEVGAFGYRAVVDSAPVLERALGEKAGLGWIGKNTMLIHPKAGSWFFLGELLTDLPLPVDAPLRDHCGSCRACLDICPTRAFTGPWQLDARRCIAYLTIELRGSIPAPLRPLIGNRVFGCDDCQLICPWNKFARVTEEGDFSPRHRLDDSTLVDLFDWTEAEFLAKTAGSAIRRVGYEGWLRNLAVGLGNAPSRPEIIAALRRRQHHPSPLVREHTEWALGRHGESVA